MNKLIIKTVAFSIILSGIISLSGCNQTTPPLPSSTGSNSLNNNMQQLTTAPIPTKKPASTNNQNPNEFDIAKLHTFSESDSDPFAGVWKISDGVGSQLESFVFAFDGERTGTMLVGSMCYCSEYGFETSKNKTVFTCQFMFGISGSYTYEISSDKKTIILTNIADNSTTTLERTQMPSQIPATLSNFKIDEKLVGAWKSDSGIYYYFSKDGIMYNNSYGAMYAFYAYSAENGIVKAKYTMTSEIEQSYVYSFENDDLIFDSDKYTRISVNDLI